MASHLLSLGRRALNQSAAQHRPASRPAVANAARPLCRRRGGFLNRCFF